ncbi:MAG: DUF2231 domain-containing protein [Phycisphaerales bacterium]
MGRYFPPLPPYDQLHPLVVHFPIALLMVAPLLIVLALLVRPWAKGLYLAALAIVVVGAMSARVALTTGDAAEQVVMGSAAMERVLHTHEELAESTAAWFAALAGALALMLGVGWKWGARLHAVAKVGAVLVYLAAHAAGLSLLARTGHEGGRLVHEFGVRSGGNGSGEPAGGDPATTGSNESTTP